MAAPGSEAKLCEVQDARESAFLVAARGDDFIGVQSYTSQLVDENGIAIPDYERRMSYTSVALQHVADSITDGIDVRGYLHWSTLHNFEWVHWEPAPSLNSRRPSNVRASTQAESGLARRRCPQRHHR